MSWIIVNKETGKAVLETWDKALTLKINTEKYKVLTAMKYLQSLNVANVLHMKRTGIESSSQPVRHKLR